MRRDGLIALDSRLCRVDAWALEAKLAEADAALLATPGVEGLHAVGEALALYRGRFLPADEHPTSIRLREALHARLVRVTAEAGRRHEAAGRWEDAVACYERALELEPGAEDLYRRLMRGYARLGRRAEALTLYARCRETLAALVGVLPSPETEALGRTLGAAQA
ncbi:MAG TPA: bacterial transcriptional activator domain-containing protein [Thermodesulfobacteriota bacterium]